MVEFRPVSFLRIAVAVSSLALMAVGGGAEAGGSNILTEDEARDGVEALKRFEQQYDSARSTSSQPVLVWWPNAPMLIPSNYLADPPRFMARERVGRNGNGEPLWGSFGIFVVAEIPDLRPRTEQNRNFLDHEPIGLAPRQLRAFLDSKADIPPEKRRELWPNANPVEITRKITLKYLTGAIPVTDDSLVADSGKSQVLEVETPQKFLVARERYYSMRDASGSFTESFFLTVQRLLSTGTRSNDAWSTILKSRK